MQTNTTTATERRDTRLRLLGALLSLLAVSLFAVRGSYAVFSDTTDNTGNDWAAGTLDLTNDPEDDGTFGDGTTAEFAEADLIPGDFATGCIDVKYSGTVTDTGDLTNVFLYTTDLSDDAAAAADALSDDLDMVVNLLDGPCASGAVSTEVYSGTLVDMPDTFGEPAIDTTWKPGVGDLTRGFEFTWTLGTDTNNDAQGDSATVDFDWEIQTP